MALPDSSSRRDLYSLTRAELQQQLVHWGLKSVHAERLWKYLYIDLVSSLDGMPELLPALAARLRAETTLDCGRMRAAGGDGALSGSRLFTGQFTGACKGNDAMALTASMSLARSTPARSLSSRCRRRYSSRPSDVSMHTGAKPMAFKS